MWLWPKKAGGTDWKFPPAPAGQLLEAGLKYPGHLSMDNGYNGSSEEGEGETPVLGLLVWEISIWLGVGVRVGVGVPAEGGEGMGEGACGMGCLWERVLYTALPEH